MRVRVRVCVCVCVAMRVCACSLILFLWQATNMLPSLKKNKKKTKPKKNPQYLKKVERYKTCHLSIKYIHTIYTFT